MKKTILLTLAALTLLALSAHAADDEWGVITIPKGQPIHLGFSAAEYTARSMKNVFRTCFNDATQWEVAAKYAATVLKLKTAVVLHDKSQ